MKNMTGPRGPLAVAQKNPSGGTASLRGFKPHKRDSATSTSTLAARRQHESDPQQRPQRADGQPPARGGPHGAAAGSGKCSPTLHGEQVVRRFRFQGRGTGAPFSNVKPRPPSATTCGKSSTSPEVIVAPPLCAGTGGHDGQSSRVRPAARPRPAALSTPPHLPPAVLAARWFPPRPTSTPARGAGVLSGGGPAVVALVIVGVVCSFFALSFLIMMKVPHPRRPPLSRATSPRPARRARRLPGGQKREASFHRDQPSPHA